MEKKQYNFWKRLFWIAAIIQFAMFTQATNITAIPPQVTEDNPSDGYAWDSWGSWSPCSRSCGGGVAVQERQCLPRSKTLATNATRAPPEITVRVTRQTQSDCMGVAKRYHECNTAPCKGGVQDMRSEQCAAYDRRPFRGRFYTWVPYIDGDSPCTLNCRPLGQHFYASLSLVADGTPCTKPGFRAICVQGVCKTVHCRGGYITVCSGYVKLINFSKSYIYVFYIYINRTIKNNFLLFVTDINYKAPTFQL